MRQRKRHLSFTCDLQQERGRQMELLQERKDFVVATAASRDPQEAAPSLAAPRNRTSPASSADSRR